jgi:hypothetical protein
MNGTTCGAAAFLGPDGPVQVPFRPCCVAMLVHAARPAPARAATPAGPVRPPFAAPVACPLRRRERAAPVAADLVGEVAP